MTSKTARQQREGKEVEMDLYGGMDLHGNNVYGRLMDREYRTVFERRLPNDWAVALKTLQPYRERIGRKAVEIVKDDGAIEASRICGSMRKTDIMPTARVIAQTGETTALRAAAIATIGELGESVKAKCTPCLRFQAISMS